MGSFVTINLNNIATYEKCAFTTYYNDKDIVIVSTEGNPTASYVSAIDKNNTILAKISDNKVPGGTGIYISADYGTKSVTIEILDKNTFPKIKNCGFGSTEHLYGVGGTIRFLVLTMQKGTPVFLPIDYTKLNYIVPNKLLIPISYRDNNDLSTLNDYYRRVTGRRVDFNKLYESVKDKDTATRQKMLNKLIFYIGRIKTCNDFAKHRNHEGRFYNGNDSYIVTMLRNLFLYDT